MITRSQAARAAAAAARAPAPVPAPVPLDGIRDVVAWHRQSAINSRIANTAARLADQANAAIQGLRAAAPRRSTRRSARVVNRENIRETRNTIEQNVSSLFTLNNEIQQFLNVEQLLYFTNESLVKDYYIRKLELAYKQPIIDKLNEICQNIAINIPPDVNIDDLPLRYDILYYYEIKTLFDNIQEEERLVSNKANIKRIIVREIEANISNEKVIINRLLQDLYVLLPTLPANISPQVERLRQQLQVRLDSLNAITNAQLNDLFESSYFENKRKYVLQILKSAIIAIQTFLYLIIKISLINSIESPLNDMYDAISYFERVVGINSDSPEVIQLINPSTREHQAITTVINNLIIIQDVLKDNIFEELTQDEIRIYEQLVNDEIPHDSSQRRRNSASQNELLFPRSVMQRNAALVRNNERLQAAIQRYNSQQAERERRRAERERLLEAARAARVSARVAARDAAQAARDAERAARAAVRTAARDAAQAARAAARAAQPPRATRATRVPTRRPNVLPVPAPAASGSIRAVDFKTDDNIGTTFEFEYNIAEVDNMYKTGSNSLVANIKNKVIAYSKDFARDVDRVNSYTATKEYFKTAFNKDEPVPRISSSIVNIVGYSVISLFARYCLNADDFKFNDLAKYFVINYSLVEEPNPRGGDPKLSIERQSGIDVGGLRRDFITALCNELFEMKIFITREGSKKYFLNPEFKLTEDKRISYIIAYIVRDLSIIPANPGIFAKFYNFLGLLISFLLVNDCGIEHQLSSYLIANFTVVPTVSNSDPFDEYDYVYFMLSDFPEYTKSIINMMKNPEEIKDIYASFNDSYDLIIDGDRDLDKDNIEEYLKLTAKYMMTRTILRKDIEVVSNPADPELYSKIVSTNKKIINRFIEGIHPDVRRYFKTNNYSLNIVNSFLVAPNLSPEIIQKLATNFRDTMNSNMRTLTDGRRAKLSKLVNIFINNIIKKDGTIPPNTETNKEYYSFIDKLIRFWSGSAFYKEKEKYKIQINNGLSEQHLPQSHTCFFQIDIPDYTGTDDEIARTMRNKMELAISNVERGIGLAGGSSKKQK